MSHSTGILMILAGLGLLVTSWMSALDNGYYRPTTALAGPMLICLGIDLVVEEPILPPERISTWMTVAIVGGIGLGVLNWYLLSVQ